MWPDLDRSQRQPELVQTEAARSSVNIVTAESEWDLPDRFSNWTRLIHVTAYIMRFITHIRARMKGESPMSDSLSDVELQSAELFWLHSVQMALFVNELRALKTNIALSKSSRLYPLSPFLGSHNLIRLGGRLESSPIDYNEKHPIILADHRVRLLIDHAHKEALHGGTQLTLRVLRQRYWILAAHSLVKGHIRCCITCTRHRASTLFQKMAALPAPRVTPTAPFTVTGLDYAGPFLLTAHITRGQRTSKNYVFVCLLRDQSSSFREC